VKDIYKALPSLFRLAEGSKPGEHGPLPDESGKPPRRPALALDAVTVRDALGPRPDPHQLAMLTFDVLAALSYLEAEIRTGQLGRSPLLVRGRPLADYLPLDTIARLIRSGRQI